MVKTKEEIAEYYLSLYGQQIRQDMKVGTTPKRLAKQIELRKQLAIRLVKDMGR